MAFDDMIIKEVRTLHNEIIIILFIKSFYHNTDTGLRGKITGGKGSFLVGLILVIILLPTTRNVEKLII